MAGRDTGSGWVPGVSLPLGRFGGVPIAAHWSALLGIALLGQLLALSVLPALAPGRPAVEYWIAGVVGALALVGSLLAHELAHATVAARRGVRVRRITLWLLGGASELEHQPSQPGDELRIALAGPAVSLLLGALLVALSWVSAVAGGQVVITATLSWLGTVNIMLGAFNLLPGAPLDGGRILHGLIWWRSGNRYRATRRAAGSGQLLGALLAGIGVLFALNGRWDGLWLILLGWFLTGRPWGNGRRLWPSIGWKGCGSSWTPCAPNRPSSRRGGPSARWPTRSRAAPRARVSGCFRWSTSSGGRWR
jgi:Zn-dependent protease